MMKRYYGMESVYYVGETDEIKAVYKSICRADRECRSNIFPAFCDPANFSERKNVYALEIESSGKMTVLSSDTMLELIVSGIAFEYTDKTDNNLESVNGYLREINSEWQALTEKTLVKCLNRHSVLEKNFSDFESLENFVYSLS